ncbi:MAG: sensor histidine kinase [Acidimicrobiia bacterium]|nr:sensor histidine kinase [Acidimicrobiia bacterium]
MKSRSWIILSIGFGISVGLIAILGYVTLTRSRAIQQEITRIQDDYFTAESLLQEIASDLHLAGLLVRDYLLEPSHITAPMHRQQLLELRKEARNRLDRVALRVSPADLDTMQDMRREVESYWDSMNPIFDWTPAQKSALSFLFLRQQVLPKRNAVLELSRRIAASNNKTFATERQQLRTAQRDFESFMLRIVLLAVCLGAVVAAVTIHQVRQLEARSGQQTRRAEQAEEELRRLSHNLVRAHEEERKSLSRELHDAVGQLLTGLRMELAGLEPLRNTDPDQFSRRVQEARNIAEESLRAVRDLSMGLRPSMLDDLGLGPALEWQGREFSRRSGIPVNVQIDGLLDTLPEPHRTCVFRVVQEALTNCAKHASASSIRVSLHGGPDLVRLTVQDDGVGFDSGEAARKGLGLVGIEERVRGLKGLVDLTSNPGRGTMLHVEFPVPKTATPHG